MPLLTWCHLHEGTWTFSDLWGVKAAATSWVNTRGQNSINCCLSWRQTFPLNCERFLRLLIAWNFLVVCASHLLPEKFLIPPDLDNLCYFLSFFFSFNNNSTFFFFLPCIIYANCMLSKSCSYSISTLESLASLGNVPCAATELFLKT